MRVNRNARLIVRNVSFKATEDSLKEYFSPYGDVQEVKLLKKPDGKLVGCAFIQYKNVPMAKNALLNTNMKPFLDRPISVDWSVAKNVYMKHIDQKNLELQEKIKQEDSDSDNETFNTANDHFKIEVKSETDEDSDDDQKPGDNDRTSGDEKPIKDEHSMESEESDDDDEGRSDGDADMSDDQSQVSFNTERKRVKLNDAEDGCTVFIKNIPFSVDNEQLKTFVEKIGPIKYALVCIDKLTEHSRGTGFAKFLNKDDADKFLSLPPQELKVEGQVLQVKPALKKESLQTDKKKQPKDNRNLYLVKEGVVVAGTRAAVGVSASDMTKRLALERSKTQMLKNLNRFVSRYRLVVSNLPPHYDDGALRKLCIRGASATAKITEARVMRDLRAPVLSNGKHPSKGYGFVMFMRHEDALACLRRLNNNPDIFDSKNRPIVSFSIEDRTALNARKKRLEKSIANNPHIKKNGPEIQDRKNRKRKNTVGNPDESKFKKGNFERNDKPDSEIGKFVRLHNDEVNEYTGLTAKEGANHKMRSNHKLKMQAEVHRKTVKMEKKKNKRTMKLKMAAKERIKQPKQKINNNTKKNKGDSEKKIKNIIRETASFSDLVSKYKSKLAGNSLEKIKSKWYET